MSLGWHTTYRESPVAKRGTTDMDRDIISDLDECISRLEDYLLAKSILLGNRDPLPFMIAQKRRD
jgi:hypothetical protein